MYEKFFRYGELKPKGWIREQLRVQANGLAGNLDKIWPDVKESRWIGGNRDSWERFPYFLDGFVPLAYLLEDEELKERADRYAAIIKSLQLENGRICPKDDTDEKRTDIWSMFLVLKVLTEYGYFTGDEECEEIVYRGLKYLSGSVCGKTLTNWAATRWYECFIPILWVYERRPEKWLLTFAARLKLQGIDYASADLIWGDGHDYWNYEKHVVNIAMALKAEALVSRLFKTPYKGQAEAMLKTLDKQCGTVYRHFNGDECLAPDDSPVRGSELCGIVEAMFSYEILLSLTGDAAWGDRLEALAFNGLPAAISGDMWAHQYNQQVNQIACVPFEHNIFGTNGREANLFGLEPHYGCCTANFGQGWPKFIRSAYIRTETGIDVVSPLPMSVRTQIGGKQVSLDCVSEYPFRNKFRLSCKGEYLLRIRIPEWAEPKISVAADIRNDWAEISVNGETEIEVEFSSEPQLVKRPRGTSFLRYGALVFSLPVAYEAERVEYVKNGVERKYPYCDYIYRTAGDWAYAFEADGTFEMTVHEVTRPYDKISPPVTIRCRVVPVKWGIKAGYKDIAEDITSAERMGETEIKEFWPYGATYLRVTELPVCPRK